MTISSKETAIFSPNKENDKKHDSCHPRGSAPSKTPERRSTLSPKDLSPASTTSDQSSYPKEQKRPRLTPAGPSASINKPNEQINHTPNEANNDNDIATLSDTDTDTDSDSESFIPLTRHTIYHHHKHNRLIRTPTPAPKEHTVPSELLHLNLEETRLTRFFSTRAARTRSTRRAILHNLHRYRYALADAGINSSIASRVWMWRHRGDVWASEEEEREGVTRMYVDGYVEGLLARGEECVEVEHDFVYEFWGGRKDVRVSEAWVVLFGGEGFGFEKRGGGVEVEVGPRGEGVGE